MEHVKGEPITAYCDRHRLGTRERIDLFVHVCEGVQHAHQKGLIHRDLKPSNVLVTLQDGAPVPKIIDFGVAKATTRPLTERTVFTELGVLIGTPEYMSPEQADLTGLDVDTRTDVYALGVLLYELLTGALPFEGRELRAKGLEEIRRTIRELEPPRPSTRVRQRGASATAAAASRRTEPGRLASALGGDLDWITMKALEKDRTHRYDTVLDLANDLRRHLRHEPVVAGPPSTVYRARKFVRRHRVGVAAAVLVLLSLLVGLGGVTAGLLRARRAERAATAAAAKAEAINEFLVETLGAANPVEGQGRAVTVLDALRGAEAKAGAAFVSQPEVEAAVRGTIGTTYVRLGFPAEAERALRAALAAAARTTQFTAGDRVALQSALGIALHDQGKLEEAERTCREALAAAEGLGRPADVLDLQGNLALVLFDRGDYAAAEPLSRAVLAEARRTLGPTDPDLAVSLNNHGRLLRALGRLDEALVLSREAVAALGEGHAFRGIALGNVGELECERGEVDAALATLAAGIAVGERALGARHADVVMVRAKLGQCLTRARRFDDAERELLAAASALRAVPDADPKYRQRVATGLADLYDAWGRPADAAAWRAQAGAGS